MSGLLWAVLTSAVVGVAATVLAGSVLRRLPEPAADAPGAADKTPYADLAGPRTAAACGGSAAAGTWLAAVTLPAAQQPPWIVLSVVGVLLAWVDLRTTWLPRGLTRIGWLAMALAVTLTAAAAADPELLIRAGGGALASGGLYAAVWALSRGGFGFGDVRFAPLVGAAAGTVSWTVCWWALLLGSLGGAVVGVARLVLRRRGPFPYAPAILLGAYLALAASAVA